MIWSPPDDLADVALAAVGPDIGLSEHPIDHLQTGIKRLLVQVGLQLSIGDRVFAPQYVPRSQLDV